MKKAVRDSLIPIILFLGLALFGVCSLFILPFDYIKYKRSPYYKNEHKKYEWFSAQGIHFKIYNEVRENNLPLRFIPHPTVESVECGWFVLGSTLVLPGDFSFDYFDIDPESQVWACYCDGEEDDKQILLSLDELIDNELQEFNRLVGQPVCTDAVVLIDKDYFENYDMAKNEKRFLVYEGDRLEVLRQFCENHP